jgi:hypothetical protein
MHRTDIDNILQARPKPLGPVGGGKGQRNRQQGPPPPGQGQGRGKPWAAPGGTNLFFRPFSKGKGGQAFQPYPNQGKGKFKGQQGQGKGRGRGGGGGNFRANEIPGNRSGALPAGWGNRWARTDQSGTPICIRYNTSGCSSAGCRFSHICPVNKPDGAHCLSSGHPASQCPHDVRTSR